MENKICKNCCIEKDLSKFPKGQLECRKCYYEKNKDRIKLSQKKYVEKCKLNPINIKSKLCPDCNIEKNVLEFQKNSAIKDGYNYRCKNCMSSYTKGLRKSETEGYIYLVINPIYPDYVKLGRTINPEKRLKNYQTYSPLRNYEMYYKCYTKNLYIIESYFNSNVSGNGEWFKIDRDKAKEIIVSLLTYKDTPINL